MNELDLFMRKIVDEIRVYLLAVGWAAKQQEVEHVDHITHEARWHWGHGGSLWFRIYPQESQDWRDRGKRILMTLQRWDSWGAIRDYGEIRVVSFSQRGDGPEQTLEREKAQAIWNTMNAMFGNELSWVNHFAPCCGPHHTGYRWKICRKYGDKWLCEGCEAEFSLVACAPPVPMAGTQEQSERAKMTSAVRWQVLERDGFTCQACGATGPDVKLHVDHKIPIAKGGKTTLDNLHVLCAPCNLGKRDKMPRQETLDLWGLAAN